MYQPENYSLEIISRLPDFNGKSLKKYRVEGIDTVGAWGNEPFEIKFKNHTYQKIQVKLSLDGTDILTGEPATSDATEKMWVVNGKETLTLKAWPETNNGGAGFVFTSGDKSVALHTHGDTSHRGIIAAAVFTEGHVEPVRINNVHHHHHHDYWWSSPYYIGGGYLGSNGSWGTTYGDNTGNYKGISGGTRGTSLGGIANASNGTFSLSADAASFSAAGAAGIDVQCNASNSVDARGLESLASVGAGSYTEQQISYTTGLIKPLLSTTVRVKYVWWDDLVAALRTNAAAEPHPSGFPGDKPLMSLGSTPRQETREQRLGRLQQQLQFARV